MSTLDWSLIAKDPNVADAFERVRLAGQRAGEATQRLADTIRDLADDDEENPA